MNQATNQYPPMILASSSDAASIQTVTGWVARDGRFWGEDERMARFCGSTHRICDVTPDHGPVENRSYCEACRAEKMEVKWQDMEKAPFLEELMPLCVFDSDRYFFDTEDLCYWLEEYELKPESVRLERLQDISRGDAMAEGCPFQNMADGPDPRKWFSELWTSTGGDWAANPWCWVIDFKRDLAQKGQP